MSIYKQVLFEYPPYVVFYTTITPQVTDNISCSHDYVSLETIRENQIIIANITGESHSCISLETFLPIYHHGARDPIHRRPYPSELTDFILRLITDDIPGLSLEIQNAVTLAVDTDRLNRIESENRRGMDARVSSIFLDETTRNTTNPVDVLERMRSRTRDQVQNLGLSDPANIFIGDVQERARIRDETNAARRALEILNQVDSPEARRSESREARRSESREARISRLVSQIRQNRLYGDIMDQEDESDILERELQAIQDQEDRNNEEYSETVDREESDDEEYREAVYREEREYREEQAREEQEYREEQAREEQEIREFLAREEQEDREEQARESDSESEVYEFHSESDSESEVRDRRVDNNVFIDYEAMEARANEDERRESKRARDIDFIYKRADDDTTFMYMFSYALAYLDIKIFPDANARILAEMDRFNRIVAFIHERAREREDQARIRAENARLLIENARDDQRDERVRAANERVRDENKRARDENERFRAENTRFREMSSKVPHGNFIELRDHILADNNARRIIADEVRIEENRHVAAARVRAESFARIFDRHDVDYLTTIFASHAEYAIGDLYASISPEDNENARLRMQIRINEERQAREREARM